MNDTDRYVAAMLGRKVAARLSWIVDGDYNNRLICELFPHWERMAVAYARAAAHAAHGLY